MILYIAEKPSLGRAIADALPKPLKKEDGCIWAANGDVVSWCFGHLLELSEPEHYDPAFKKWQLDHLPIIPDKWQLQSKAKTRKQIALLRKLTKKSTQIVHAGDPDREGQLLVDEVIDYLQVDNTKKQRMKRCLINDLSPNAVKKALQNLRDNKEFIPLSISALARSRADWLYGINMTRAYTLQGQKAGYQGVLSVGRVQTPVLGLIVRRDLEIAGFVSRPFYEVFAELQTANGESLIAKWKPSEACIPWLDEDGRVLSKSLADKVVRSISGQLASVKEVSRKEKRNNPPLPYSLSSLQMDANRLFSLSAQQVLDLCQTLYEKHKLITYPRSDSNYLPEEMHIDAAIIVRSLLNNCPEYHKHCNQWDLSRKNKAWNDKKVDAHHAIIPTSVCANLEKIGKNEKLIYSLISKRYLMQFMLPYKYEETCIDLNIAGGLFISRANRVVDRGWKALLPVSSKSEEESSLPLLIKGQELSCISGRCEEKMTQPPKAYTDATLLSAMTGIARFVENLDIRKVLKETDGLGTEATRAGILELLVKRRFILRQGKNLQSTPTGKALINSLPEIASRPDMTAKWEAVLSEISEKKQTYVGFMNPLQETLTSLVHEAIAMDISSLKHVSSGQTKRKPSGRRRTKKKSVSKGAYKQVS